MQLDIFENVQLETVTGPSTVILVFSSTSQTDCLNAGRHHLGKFPRAFIRSYYGKTFLGEPTHYYRLTLSRKLLETHYEDTEPVPNGLVQPHS